jgi:hypothetical protein
MKLASPKTVLLRRLLKILKQAYGRYLLMTGDLLNRRCFIFRSQVNNTIGFSTRASSAKSAIALDVLNLFWLAHKQIEVLKAVYLQ